MAKSNMQMRDAFISELFSRAKADRDIVLVSNDQGAVALDQFRDELAPQFINGGVSEQNIISLAAGLALSGKTVYVYSIASFIMLRCYEQIKIDLCSMDLPVTIFGVGAGYSYAMDGPTHHATEDIAIMRALSNMNIYSPADSNITTALVDVSIRCPSPMYIRMDRDKFPPIYDVDDDFSPGFSVLRPGDDVCIVATGVMVHRAMEIAEELNKTSIEARVIDVYRLKPLNSDGIVDAIDGSRRIVTVEEHTVHGGLGSIMAELLIDYDIRIPLKRFAVQDHYLYCYGGRADLHKERGLDKESIAAFILKADR